MDSEIGRERAEPTSDDSGTGRTILEKLVAKRSFSQRNARINPRLKPKPVRTSDDSHGHSIFSWHKDLMDALTPTIHKHISFDGSSINSPSFSRKTPSPRGAGKNMITERSSESLFSSRSLAELGWNQATLLDLSDSVRCYLRSKNEVGPDAKKLSDFLEAVVRDEEHKQPSLDFETIQHARLDKLLFEFLQFAEDSKEGGIIPHRLRAEDVSHARCLRQVWRRRFRERFFMMDHHRCAMLIQGGRLKDVEYNASLEYDLSRWQAKTLTGPVSELEGNQQFEPGHWWLNITCAERDGIVGSSLETPTKGRYGITVLPLLTGSEELVGGNMIKYLREGEARDMHISLISQVGRQIRILRGHELKSMFAPEAGLRYDGLYTIRQYGLKQDSKTNAHRLELTLERVEHQTSFDEICKLPKPSQLDDWNLYERLEGKHVRLTQGETSFLEWKLKREQEKIERQAWRRAKTFPASFSGITPFSIAPHRVEDWPETSA
ncbi:hypothetical protein F5Y16DRAFT_396407 [Xylariaceae sp. FL0255]|nr:hypothetical protein F5Y16DRAFT_396407 [Xylariaceae sp. FL0255]